MVKKYRQFIENDLKKVYLFSHSDRFSFSHIDSLVRAVSGEMFQLLMPPGIFPESIDKNLPVLNYGNTPELQDLLDDKVIDRKNVYNLPEFLKNANSKLEFHKRTKDLKFVPKTVFNKKAAMDLKFPVIAKPADGSKGEGIEVFKTKEELQAADENKFEVYSEKFDLKREFRVVSLKGNIVYVAERIPENKKAVSLREGKDIFDREGTLDGRSSYRWKTITFTKNGGPKDLPEVKAFASICKLINDKLKLEFLGIDIGLDSNGKLWCIEANTCPGLNKDQVVLLYRAVFEDFYGRPVDQHTNKELKKFSNELKRANKDKAKFSFSPHQGNRFYYYDDKIDLQTGEHKGKSLLTMKYNIEKSFGDTMKNIKNKNESRIMDFDGFVMNEKQRIAPNVGDTSLDIQTIKLKDVLEFKVKPKSVHPHLNNKPQEFMFVEPSDMESGSKNEDVEIVLEDGTPVFIDFDWSWGYKKGKKSGDYDVPNDQDEYPIEDVTINSVYIDETAIEVDEELNKLLVDYFTEYLPK